LKLVSPPLPPPLLLLVLQWLLLYLLPLELVGLCLLLVLFLLVHLLGQLRVLRGLVLRGLQELELVVWVLRVFKLALRFLED
jgi:hypothetical protein